MAKKGSDCTFTITFFLVHIAKKMHHMDQECLHWNMSSQQCLAINHFPWQKCCHLLHKQLLLLQKISGSQPYFNHDLKPALRMFPHAAQAHSDDIRYLSLSQGTYAFRQLLAQFLSRQSVNTSGKYRLPVSAELKELVNAPFLWVLLWSQQSFLSIICGRHKENSFLLRDVHFILLCVLSPSMVLRHSAVVSIVHITKHIFLWNFWLANSMTIISIHIYSCPLFVDSSQKHSILLRTIIKQRALNIQCIYRWKKWRAIELR